jgi:ABC-type dipeptide/oligopeptide/nickel transport system permease component
MLRYIVRRLLQGVVVLFFVSLGTFGLMHVAPGDPIYVLIGEEGLVTEEQIDAIRAQWGLDRPWYQQYLTWLGNMVRGDFGNSVVRRGVPVNEMIREAAPVTIQLNILALALAVGIALPIGVIAGIKRYSTFDYTAMIGSTLGIALPNFWLALMAIVLFALVLGWLPAFGLRDWKGYILPVAVLATEQTALFARMMRSSVVEVINQDYVTVARAKGLGEYPVVLRHIVRNSLLPVITVIGYRIAFILSGTIIVEYVFALPGLGRLLVDSIHRLDYQVVQAIVILLTVVVVLGNLATDLVYAYIDPRIRLQ